MSNSYIIQQIRAKIEYERRDEALYHYRVDRGAEIDIIVEHPAKPLTLVEIKSTSSIREDHVASLNNILPEFEKKRESRAICLSTDPHSKRFGTVNCHPWKEGIAAIFS